MKVSYPVLHSVTLKEDEKVVPFTGVTTERISPDRILMSALNILEDVIVVGWRKDGHLHTASSNPNGPEFLWLLRMAEAEFLEAHALASEEAGS